MPLSSTHSSTIRQAQASHGLAWADLVEKYGPWIYLLTRARGVPPSDVEDVVQEVFAAVARALPQYQQGSFRGWLIGILQHKVTDYFRRQRAQPPAEGGSAAHELLQSLPNLFDRDEDPESSLSLELADQLAAAVEQVRGATNPQRWSVFLALVVELKPPADVAAEHGLSVGAVHQCKFDLCRRLRDALINRGVQPPD